MTDLSAFDHAASARDRRALRLLLSLYTCEPEKGSEPGAGYALLRAAAAFGECWVLTRSNNLTQLKSAFAAAPSAYPVHFIGVEGPRWLLSLKRRFGFIIPYYVVWQRRAGRMATALDRAIDFDLVHHGTFSSFWLPVGVSHVDKPLIVGPVSGGTTTPRRVLRYLGARGALLDAVRWSVGRALIPYVKRTWIKRATLVIAQNRNMAQFMARHGLRGHVESVTFPHALTPDLESANAPQRSDPEPLVLFVGRLVAWKGPFLALRAFSLVAGADAKLVFVGTGPASRRLRHAAERLGIGDRVSLLGNLPRESVLSLMQQAAVLLFPSFHDSAGFVVSEALSLGLPVVCLNQGGPGTLVTYWPSSMSEAVSPVGPRIDVDLAAAVDRFLHGPPVERSKASTSLADALAKAYGEAIAPSCDD